MLKKIVLSVILTVGLLSSYAQTDQRTRETKIADIVMLLPADNTSKFNQLMGELYGIGNVIADLAPQLADPGGNDAQIRYAISGLTMYASKTEALKSAVAKELCTVIPKAKSDEIRDFLLIQLQYVAVDESVATVTQYLNNARLCDAAVRVLVRIGNENAAKAIFDALPNASGTQQISLIEGLGYLRYQPAADAIASYAGGNDGKVQKTVLFALSQFAIPSSEKLLYEAAEKAAFQYEPTDALYAYISYLKNLFVSDQVSLVSKNSKKLLKATSEKTQIAAKTAALEMISLSSGEKAVSELINALSSDSKPYREAALKFTDNISSPKMYEALMKKATKEKRPEVKAEIISVFGARGDVEALPFITGCLSDSNIDIRKASIIAAGKIGREKSIKPIITSMNVADAGIVETGKKTLTSIGGPVAVSEIAAAIPQATPQAKVAFLDILASRKANNMVGVVFAQTKSDQAPVRLASYKALSQMAQEGDAQQISQLLSTASDPAEITALQNALYASISSLPQEEQTRRLTGLMKTGRNPALYYNVFAKVGGEDALKMVMLGMKENDTRSNDAAFEALINWKDASAISALFDIAENNPKYADRAFTSYVSKVNSAQVPSEQRLLLLRKALDIAKKPDQKRDVLSQVGRTGTFVGLITAGKYLDDRDNAVQQAAVQAVRVIALAHPEYYGKMVTDILNKAIAVNKDAEAEYQKQALLKHMAALPSDDGFVSMFNGRDLTGWKGL
ncbi:MAG: HEAT repeat domain-containing protein, partial [Bacteroidales bacterium]|nr:HEAT repeat domain-containing protein [Bacteroidales bacterium]